MISVRIGLVPKKVLKLAEIAMYPNLKFQYFLDKKIYKML